MVDYHMHLGETVLYVGGAALQAAGFDGTRGARREAGQRRGLHAPQPRRAGTAADYADRYAQKNVAPSGACAGLFDPARRR
ncbi:MAG: hypothetical protein U1F49_07780 [Rubrivivax sp.]